MMHMGMGAMRVGFARRAMSSASKDFDYVIVGAGSAGCVLANRLSSDPQNRVLLIEAGPEDSGVNWLPIRMPAMMLHNINGNITRLNWAYPGEPEPELGGRSLKHDRGKALGGSSSINGMVYIRGHAQDFEGWRRSGCDGWGYEDVLPYFKRLESLSCGGDTYRGGDGPMHVYRPSAEDPLSQAFLKAGEEAGYPLTDDLSGYKQEGFGVLDRTGYKGQRWSTASGYLAPARERPNLEVVTGALVQRVSLEGNRATGVMYKDKRGQEAVVRGGEVILSAGAVGTPHVMMLSGLGPAAHLQEMGITVHADLPGVGANLNDHPDFVMKFKCAKPITLYPYSKPIAGAMAGIQWLTTGGGICGSNHFEAAAQVRSGPGVEYPDLQLTLSPIAMEGHSFEPMQEHAFQMHVGLMQTQSRGSIRLKSSDPATPPAILANYLQDGRDLEVMRTGIRLIRELVETSAFSELRGDEIYPGAAAQSDEELGQVLKEGLASQWHLSGTARMGAADDPDAVVDPEGRVRGVGNLRVVDASVMPFATNGNTNSPTIMLAEKLSDAILGLPALPRVSAEVWKNPQWQTSQR